MDINKVSVALVFKVIILIICVLVLIRKTGLIEGKFSGNIFFLFTNLTILLCAIFYGIDIYNCVMSESESELLLNMKGAILQYTFITMLIYNFVLVPKHRNTGINYKFYSLQDIAVHYAVPILVIIEWLITHTKSTGKAEPFKWLLIPLAYFVGVSIKGKLKKGDKFDYADSYYPYFFIDVGKVGLKKVVINLIVLLLFFLGIGYIIVAFDNWVF